MHWISYQGQGDRIISSSFSTLHEYMLPAIKLSSSSATAGVAFPASWPLTQTSFFYWPVECGRGGGGCISEASVPYSCLPSGISAVTKRSPLWAAAAPAWAQGRMPPRVDHSPHCSEMPQPPRKVSQII